MLVVGGSGGIGRAVCVEFARHGWAVGVHYTRRLQEAETTAELVAQAGGTASLWQADVRDAAQVRTMVDRYAEERRRLDALIVGSGVDGTGLVLRMTPEQWGEAVDVNLTGVFHCLQSAGRIMTAHRRGSIVVLASFVGFQGQTGQAAYAASKAGTMGLVRAAAYEWGEANVRVNALCPGWHDTALTSGLMPAVLPSDHALRRFVDRDDVARTVYHLAELPAASGQVWNVDSRIVEELSAP